MLKITAFIAFNLSTEGRDFALSVHPYMANTLTRREK